MNQTTLPMNQTTLPMNQTTLPMKPTTLRVRISMSHEEASQIIIDHVLGVGYEALPQGYSLSFSCEAEPIKLEAQPDHYLGDDNEIMA